MILSILFLSLSNFKLISSSGFLIFIFSNLILVSISGISPTCISGSCLLISGFILSREIFRVGDSIFRLNFLQEILSEKSLLESGSKGSFLIFKL